MSVNLPVSVKGGGMSGYAAIFMVAVLFVSTVFSGGLSAAAGAAPGYSVDISGDYAVVGAPWHGGYRGAAYVLQRDGDRWVVQQELKPGDLGPFDHFGCSVSIDGGRIVVGASWHDLQRGAAYVFNIASGEWAGRQKLMADGAATESYFGTAVDMAETGLTVRTRATERRGPAKAYSFGLSGARWSQLGAEETPTPNTGTFTVGDRAIAGAPGDAASNEEILALVTLVERETGEPAPPAAPAALEPVTTVAATDSTMEDRVKVTWDNTGQDAIAYKVLRGTDLISLVSSDGSSYDDTGGEPDTTYSYCVVVTDMASEETDPVCDEGTRIIFAPHNVTASDGRYIDEVVITWVDISTINEGYNIYRDDALIATIGPNEIGYSDTDVDSINVHTYEVAAYVSGGYESARKSDDGWRGVILPPLEVSASDGLYIDRVLVEWQDPDTLETGYRIYRDSVLIDSTGVDGESFMDSTVVYGETYTYCVAAKGAGGGESVRVCDEGGTGLTPPGSVSASDSTYDDRIRITWDDLSDHEDGYEITRIEYEVPPPEPPLTYAKTDTRPIVLAASDSVVLGSVGVDDTSYDDFTAIPGMVYTYSVRAVSDEGGASTEVSDEGYRSVVLAPYELTATDGTYEDYVDLSWKSISTTTALFKILRDGVFIKTVSGGDRSYRDYGGTAGQDYSYSITAITALGVEAAGPADAGKRELIAPSGLTASDEGYEEKTVISWRDYSKVEQGYLVMRRDTASAVVDSFVIGSNRGSYTDYTGSSGVTYMYSVEAFDSLNGTLGYSVPAEDIGRRVLLAPTGVSVDTGVSETAAEVTWRDNSGAEDGYRIYRDSVEIGTTPDNSALFIDSFVVIGQNHLYRVHAYDAYGESAGDSSLGFTSIAAPLSFNASDVYDDRVELTWVDQSDVEDGFNIYRDGMLLETIDEPDVTAYTDLMIQGGVNLDTPGDARGVAVAGDFAYIADNSAGLQIVDISDTETPVLRGSVGTTEAIAVAVADSFAYVADNVDGLVVIDVSDPMDPEITGSYDTGGLAGDIVVIDSLAYVTCSDNGLQVINISDPDNLSLVYSWNDPEGAEGYPQCRAVTASGDYLCVLYSAERWDMEYCGVQFFDISDPTSIVPAGYYNDYNNTLSGGKAVAITGDYVIFSYGYYYINIVDFMSDPDNPTVVSDFSLPDFATGIAAVGEYVFVAVEETGLYTIDIGTPLEPALLGTYYTPGSLNDLAVIDNHVFIADNVTGLEIVAVPLYPGVEHDYCVQAFSSGIVSEKACDGGMVPDTGSETNPTEIIPKITASDGSSGDRFGYRVSLSGDYAIIGAIGDYDTPMNYGEGSAYIFERSSGETWSQVARLADTVGHNSDYFSYGVAISGNRAMVGSRYDDEGYTNTGSVFVYERNADGNWEEKQKLLASVQGVGDNFGTSVAISGDYAIIGADKADSSVANSGAAFIFERSEEGVWEEKQKLGGSNTETNSEFGSSVSIDGDIAIVGGPKHDGVSGYDQGGAWIFERNAGGTWEEKQYLVASDAAPYDAFGACVSLRGDLAIVGAAGNDDDGDWSGSAYLFERDATGTWAEKQKLTASDATKYDRFGCSVSINEKYATVGADGDNYAGGSAGAVYVFEQDMVGVWHESQKLVASDRAADDQMGASVSLHGDRLMIGAPSDGDNGNYSGSVYIAELTSAPANVAATDGTLESRVRITWEDNSINERGFRIYRDGEPVGSVEPNVTGYEDFDAEPGRTYEYAVAGLTNDISSESDRVADFGWRPANGNITGSITTLNGNAVDSVWIEVTPSQTKALLLDGRGGFVTVLDYAGTFDFNSTESYTIEAWIKYSLEGGTGAGDGTMFAKAAPGGGAGRFPFTIGNMRSSGYPGRIRFAISDGVLAPVEVESDSAGFNDNAWHHVACVHDADSLEIRLYIDGALQGSSACAGLNDIINAEPLTFGAGPDAESWFGGLLDEVRIWNVARSDSSIDAAMTKPLAGDEEGLIAYWPLDDVSAGIITDLTAEAHYGTFEWGVYFTDDCPDLDIYPMTDDLGNYVVKGLYYGTESEFEVRPFADNRAFDPAVKRVVLTTDSPVENQVEFTDISTYLVTGIVLYDSTACASADINLLVDGEPGGQSDTKGKFSLDLERGGHWIRPSLEGHAFEPESLYVDAKLDGVIFEDLTVRTLSGGLGGGCGRLIGDITLTVLSENGCLLRTYEYSSVDSVFDFSADLPPQNYLVSASVDVMSIPEGLSKTDVVRFFQNLGSRMAEMDSVDVEMDFVYRAPLKVEIAGFDEYLEYLDTCSGPLTFGERVLPDNLPVIPQLSEVVCSIQVYEDYGAGGLCELDSGTVTIYDELFDALNEPVELEVRDGLAVYPTIAIAPSLIIGRTDEFGVDRSFQRSLTAIVNVEGRDPVSAAQWALVTGHLAPEGADFVTGTTEIPMYILRDPPGDQSYAFLEEGHSLRTRIDWDNSLHLLQGGLFVEAHKGFKIGFWKFKISFKAFAETDWLLGKEWSDENYTDYTVTTKRTFSTSGDDGAIGAEGDVFVGVGHNFIFSEVGVVDVDFDNCAVEKTVSVGFEPDSVATFYSYTQQYIEETLIPELYSKVDYYSDEGDSVTSTYFRVKAEYWEELLQENEELKRLASTTHNRSFSAGTEYTYYHEESTEETYTRTSKFVLDGSLKVGLEASWKKIGGTVALQGSWHHENLLSYTDTTGTETTAIGYAFGDDDGGDHFTVDIKDDGRYPTPVFDVPAGVSSCPYEPWEDPETGEASMMPRDKPALNIAPLELSGVPPDEPAVFTVNLSNLSPTDETRLYVLRTLNTFNPYGAIVKVGDVPIANGLSYLIETSQAQQATLTVERGPTRYNYEDLALVLYPPCEAGDWDQSGALADTLYFDVSFDAPCSDLTMLLPENGWVYDSEDQDSTRGILMLLTDYERQISETDTIQSVWGQFRCLGVDSEGPAEWTDIPADSLGEEETVIIWYPPENLEDGVYEIRAYTKCASGRGYSETATGTIERHGPMVFGTPEPADGELSFGEDISVTFNKLIDCASVCTDTLMLYPDRLTLSYADWPDSGATIGLETVCDGQTVIITPTVIGSALEGRRLRATVTGVTDGAGNPMVSPATWEFDYRKSKFAWSKLHVTADVAYRNAGEVTAELANGTGEPATFTIGSLPSWIESVSPAGGTIPPSGTQAVVFTLPDTLRMDGDYGTEIRATAGEDAAVFDLYVTVSCHEPDWIVVPGDFEHSMTMVAEVKIGDTISTSHSDMLAAVVGGELRGVAHVQEAGASHLAFLTVYSNRTEGETVRFKVWDAASCKLYNGTDSSYPFVPNGSIGSVSAPVTLTAAEIEDNDVLTVAANSGWTWISTNVLSADMSVTSILADLNLTSGDLIKSHDEFSQFVEYTYPDSVPTWVPPFELDNVSGYMVNVVRAGTIRQAGTEVAVDTTFIPVKQGWNWIGYLPTTAVGLSSALSDLNAAGLVADGDIVKSQYAFAEYLGGVWYGSLTEMEPGRGYKLMLSSDVDSSFAYPPPPYTVPPPALASGDEAPEAAEGSKDAPDWSVDPHEFQFNMTVTAMVRIDGLDAVDGNDIIGAFVGNECRGVARPFYVSGLKRHEVFLMVYSNEASGEKVTFRTFDADAGVVLDIEETIDCVADAVRGTVTQPVVLNAAEEDETPGAPDAFALYQNVPNPFNPSTMIRFDLPSPVHVRLCVYNVKGELVRTIINEGMTEGRREVNWAGTNDHGSSVASGVYFYRLTAGEFVQTKKMVLLR